MKNLWVSAAVAAVVMLGGCSRSDAPQAGGNWSTLGNRVSAAAPAKLDTSAPAAWASYAPPAQYPAMNTSNTSLTLPDGTQLSVAVGLPADADGNTIAGPLPTILTLTGYDKNLTGGPIGSLVEHGYAHVVIDVRGTGSSQGTWNMFGDIEQADDGPILDWLVAQPFCNGSVGVFGESLLGITAELAASQRHPAIKAAFLSVPMGDAYRDIVFNGGEASVSFIPAWFGLVMGGSLLNPAALSDPATGVPLAFSQLLDGIAKNEVPLLLKAIAGDGDTVYDGDFWGQRSPVEKVGKIRVPTFIVGGLHDVFQRGEPLLYETIKPNAPVKLLIGPWTHVKVGDGLPAEGVPSVGQLTLQWFDRYLRGLDSGAEKIPNVTQYVWGLEHYVTSADWPHPQASAQRLYLHGDKSLNVAAPAANEASNVTLQQPLDGLCSASTVQWTAGIMGYLPLPCFTDNTMAESLDVKYETAPLTQDVYINGPIAADLWVSTTASDATVSVRVDDVSGNTATPLTAGMLLMSARALDAGRSRTLDGQVIQPWHPFTQAAAQSVQGNTPTQITVEVFPTSALIKAGHKLRISIGPSDFPHGLPPLPQLLGGALGILTVHSDAQHPSSVVLPVVPASVLPAN